MTRSLTATRGALLASIGLAGLIAASPALGQDPVAEPQADQPAEATGTGDSATATNEIVVTARRRNEILQDVPIAVTAYTGEQLERQGALDITDIGDTTPNVTIETSRGTNSTLTSFIRGVGQQDPVAGFEQGVGLYLDDVYLNRPQGSVLDIYDVDRIEVLRGPQGTLYGRNTIGGAIKYVTRRLPDDPELRIRAHYGSYDQADMIISASLPLTEGFKVGASAARLSRGGFGTNLTTGEENYNKDVWAFRGTIEMEPTDNIFIRLSGDHSNDNSNTRGGHRLITSLRSGAPVLDDVYDSRGALAFPEQKVRGGGIALHIDVGLGENLKLRSISAYRADTSTTPIDFDALPTVSLDVPGRYENSQLSQEFQLLYESGRLNGVAGLYLLDADALTFFDVRLYDFSPFFPGFTASTESTIGTKTWAVFGDFTFDISEQLSVSAGGRYTDDKRQGRVLRRSYLFGGSTNFGGSPPFGNGTQAGGATSDFTGKRKDTAFTPRLSLSFKPSRDHHLYASWSKGFKGGGFDPRGQTTQAPDSDGDGIRGEPDEIYDYMAFDPEKVTSYELGYKASLFDRRVSTSLAVFHSDYTDMQIPSSVPCLTAGGAANFCGLTSNAGKARIRGVEWEGNARILGQPGGSQRLNFGWSLGYLDGKFKEFVSLVLFEPNGTPIPAPGVERNIADALSIQNTPKWTASGTLTYLAEIAGGDLSLSSTVSYRSKSQQFELPVPMLDQKGFSLWDASGVYTLPGGRYSIGLHGKNLTDKQYITAGYNFLLQNPYTGQFILPNGQPGFSPNLGLGQEGVLTAYYGNPRQIFVSLSAKF
jgi:iron complex outermembrane receptor protein